jgi:putative transposase
VKKSPFTEHQIVAMLNEAESGVPVKEVCRKHGVSSATYHKRKCEYGRFDASDPNRLKELESELGQYKRMYAEMAHENYAL